jgi:cation diffusion facilitator family transporter
MPGEATSRPAAETAPPCSHCPPEVQAREVRRVTFYGLFVNLTLAAAKFVVGTLGASQALMADAVHSLSDSATDVVVLVGSRYWSAPADADHPHGHGRYETLISLIIGISLAGVGVGLCYRGVLSLQAPPKSPPGWIVLAAACAAAVIKEILYHWTARVGKRVKSSAAIANAWHHRSDALSSVPVAAAALGSKLNPSWVFLDPVAAVLVSVFIIHAAAKIAMPALNELLDRGANKAERETIRALALDTPGVMAVHALRTRHIGPGLQVDIHVLVAPDLSVREGHNIAGAVKSHLVTQGPDVMDVLIHVEPYEPEKDGNHA